jgi:hypothetical protein
MESCKREGERERLTKYSDVLPEASLTPPLNTIVEEVVCCGVCDRVAGVVVPLRIVVPLSQLPTLLLPDDIERERDHVIHHSSIHLET